MSASHLHAYARSPRYTGMVIIPFVKSSVFIKSMNHQSVNPFKFSFYVFKYLSCRYERRNFFTSFFNNDCGTKPVATPIKKSRNFILFPPFLYLYFSIAYRVNARSQLSGLRKCINISNSEIIVLQ